MHKYVDQHCSQHRKKLIGYPAPQKGKESAQELTGTCPKIRGEDFSNMYARSGRTSRLMANNGGETNLVGKRNNGPRCKGVGTQVASYRHNSPSINRRSRRERELNAS